MFPTRLIACLAILPLLVLVPPMPKSAPTFSKDVAKILYQKCASCHRPGEVAPFSLLTYDDAKKRAKQIAEVTEKRYMPPWGAEPGSGDFLDARVLTDAQIQTLKDWAEAGAPKGDLKSSPRPPKYTQGWTLGRPDAVFEPSEEFTIGAEGPDVYRCFVIPTNFDADRYISAMEVRPGNRQVVHHVIAYLDVSGTARELDKQQPGPGYTSFGGLGFLPSGALGGWAPGMTVRRLQPDVGIFLPKGADIVMQVHYHKSGKEERDRSKIGIYFAKGQVDKRLRSTVAVYPSLNIPPGDPNYTVHSWLPVTKDVTVLMVMPHMHLLGKSMTLTAKLPDKTEKPLVRVANWDFNWQTTYALRTPLKLPKGSRIDLTARYDNSAQNPRNPSNPPKRVHWGEQTTDEMCIGFIFYTVDSESLTKGKPGKGFGVGFDGTPAEMDPIEFLQTAIGMFDHNNNGRLDPPEQAEMLSALRRFTQGRVKPPN